MILAGLVHNRNDNTTNVSRDVISIGKDSEDIPQFTLIGDSRFSSIIDKIFEVTYDNNAWFRMTEDSNASMTLNTMFENERGLFLNSTFFYISALRNMTSDFGILPYPKYTESQDSYYSRVEGGEIGFIPVTNSSLELTGVMLEALSAESARTVIPAYYEVALKTKFTRDPESADMLDIIFNSRIYDLGDTYWCDFLRDGIFKTMFTDNDRALVSKLESIEGRLNKAIESTINAFAELK